METLLETFKQQIEFIDIGGGYRPEEGEWLRQGPALASPSETLSTPCFVVDEKLLEGITGLHWQTCANRTQTALNEPSVLPKPDSANFLRK